MAGSAVPAATSPTAGPGYIVDDRYVLERQLGSGTMGTAYLARHAKIGRAVAIKLLHRHLLEEPLMRKRFQREALLAGRLHHKNVAAVIDVGETPAGESYIVMEFADGTSLANLIEGPMSEARVAGILGQLLDGLDHAHRTGLVHRDLKPENIIVGRDDHGGDLPRIVDFGIAIGDVTTAGDTGKLTTVGMVLGTPHFMAPEQAAGIEVDARADLFALGVCGYELLAGVTPFDGDGVDVIRATLSRDAPPLGDRVPGLRVDPLLDLFVRRLMARRREHRPVSAHAARQLLDLISTDRDAAAVALGHCAHDGWLL